MSKSIRGWLMVGIGMALSVSHLAGSKSEDIARPGLRITVRVFNHTQVSLENWKSAQVIANRIFDRAGIETVWMICSLSSEGQYTPSDCALPPRPTDIIVRLVPTSKASRAHFGNAALGVAALSEKGTPASASIFYDRVEELAKGGAAPVAVILGHATAHEIGHLLLGSNSDSSLGLMCGRWSRSNLGLANDGQLNFLHDQVVSLQKEVRRRAI